jgi:hypothetical protein
VQVYQNGRTSQSVFVALESGVDLRLGAVNCIGDRLVESTALGNGESKSRRRRSRGARRGTGVTRRRGAGEGPVQTPVGRQRRRILLGELLACHGRTRGRAGGGSGSLLHAVAGNELGRETRGARRSTPAAGAPAQRAGLRADQPAPCYLPDMSVARAQQEPEVDWTGVAPDSDPIEPLTAETFITRLESLTEALAALDRLKSAFDDQHGGPRP